MPVKIADQSIHDEQDVYKRQICPCAFVMLMSDGKIEPFVFATDKDIERIANKGHTGFTGFVPTK